MSDQVGGGLRVRRLALPLQERGLSVHGVENSPWMVEKLRKKPGGDTLAVTMGDFATVAVDGRFGLVVLAYTTFLELASQELQIECFHNAKRHLERRVARGNLTPGLPQNRLCRDRHNRF